jgi:hypothetical protein
MKKETFHFTVRELAEILKSFPQDMPVLVSGYESGFENFMQPFVKKLKHEPENMYYEGEFQYADNDEKDTFEGVVLIRNERSD